MNCLPENLCLAPYAYLTFDPAKNVSPCPALGGSVWNFKKQDFHKIWTNKELTDFRTHMMNNKKHNVCHRCWNEEAVGMDSERTMLWNPAKDPTGTESKILFTDKTAQQVLKDYNAGPMQIIIKVGNICNLRCRSCNSADSITLAVEGQYYADNYGLKNNFYIKETETKVFTDNDIDEIISFCGNVRRIEFYGGEPLMDKQLPVLLQKLIEINYADKISLNISTNITQLFSEHHIELLSKFNHLNLNLSIDGWGPHFTYLRHPAKWSTVYNNFKKFIELTESNRINMSLLPVITVTSMNVYYLPELISNLQREFNLSPFLILAWHPMYYSIRNIPEDISAVIADKLSKFDQFNLGAIVNALNDKGNPKFWDQFKQWTAMVDDYRGESFAETFPEYTSLIRQYDANFL